MKNKEIKFKLVRPTIEYKKKAIKYIKEHKRYRSPINGSSMLYSYLKDYEGWLEKIEKEKNIITNKEEVPSETFFLVETNTDKIIGMINLRLDLNEKVKNSYASVGYGIRPKERRKGYNKINLYLGLLEYQKRVIKNIIISCEKENIASAKTIKALGGNFDKEMYDEKIGTIIQFYRIDVDYSIAINKEKYRKFIEN